MTSWVPPSECLRKYRNTERLWIMNPPVGDNTMEKEEDNYTKDGTVDYHGNPANRKKTGTWKACPYILGTYVLNRLIYDNGHLTFKKSYLSQFYVYGISTGTECCERLAYYGMSSNLVLYFKHQLNQQSATASKNQSDWAGTCYITPLIGAFLADAYLGRYWTIACFSIIYVFVSLVSWFLYVFINFVYLLDCFGGLKSR